MSDTGWLVILVASLVVIILATIFDVEADYRIYDDEVSGKSYTRRERANQRAQRRELARMRRIQ